MNWAALFGFINIVALIGWTALALLPRRPLTLSLIMYAGVGLLCLTYAVMFVLLFGNFVDPGRAAGAPVPNLTDYSVAGLRSLFMSDGAIVIGWTHYLAFDLFVGLWIARDADHKRFSRIAQLPFLFATLMAGPIGLVGWLLFREARARRMARA